jgi:hypothetical protein
VTRPEEEQLLAGERATGGVQTTRFGGPPQADYFLDSKEIEHGLKVLSVAARTALSEPERMSFVDILKAVRERLQSCYVLSLSQDPESEYLQSNYARDSGVVLEFEEDFLRVLYTGWHAIPNGDDSFRCHYIVDIYDFFEGFVVYDDSHQQQLSTIACLAYRELLSTDAHIVDSCHFINILLQCLILFKSRKHKDEKEYRVAPVRMPRITESFEETRDRVGCRHVYIAVRIPIPRAAAIRATNL